MKIAIIIPAYNEEDRIGETLKGLLKIGLPMVVVDDGSKDRTSLVAQKHADYFLKHRINMGKGSAMKTGAEFAFKNGFEAVIYFDADGQHSTEDLSKFIDKLNDGYEIILGTRTYSYDVPLVRYIGNKFASLLVSLLFGLYVSDLICGFRALTKNAYKQIIWESKGYGVETEMAVRISKTKLKMCEVPVKTIYLDSVKGVTLLDAFNILFQVFKWRIEI